MEPFAGLKVVAQAIVEAGAIGVDPQLSVISDGIEPASVNLAEHVIESAPGTTKNKLARAAGTPILDLARELPDTHFCRDSHLAPLAGTCPR